MTAARFYVRLTPRAARSEIGDWRGDALAVRVNAPPVEGRANAALVRLLADALGVASSRVKVVAGTTGRTKLIEVEGLSREEVMARLGGPG